MANERRHCAGRKQSDCGTRPARHASFVLLSLAAHQKQCGQRQVAVRGLEGPPPQGVWKVTPSPFSPGLRAFANTIVDMGLASSGYIAGSFKGKLSVPGLKVDSAVRFGASPVLLLSMPPKGGRGFLMSPPPPVWSLRAVI